MRLVFVSAVTGNRVLQTHTWELLLLEPPCSVSPLWFFFSRCRKEITLTGLLCYDVLYLYFFIHLSHVCNAGNVKKYTTDTCVITFIPTSLGILLRYHDHVAALRALSFTDEIISYYVQI